QVSSTKLAKFHQNQTREGMTTSIYCEAKDIGITIDRPLAVVMVGVHGEQKRPLGEIDNFPIT
ncbi:6378_t:CDS:2, partial [Gigaspora margarita]